MVYQKDSKFVAVVTCNGKILRDFKNDEDNYQVKMPFGEEYGIRIKNLNTTRVAFNVHIDGEDVLGCSRIVLDPNESHDLEGFMVDNVVKNKFKFIEKTEKISDHRGDKIDDGMIRIEYQFEKKPAVIKKRTIVENSYLQIIDIPEPTWERTTWTTRNIPHDGLDSETDAVSKKTSFGFRDKPQGSETKGASLNNVDSIKGSTSQEVLRSKSFMQTNSVKSRRITDFKPAPEPAIEEGITVKGSQTNIKYKTGSLGAMEEVKHVMILTLSGHKESSKKKVAQAVTVRQKVECETCGTKNRSSNKFCSDCGTCLV